MAIYHLSVKPVQRSKGRSATAAAAYRAAERIVDERTGEIHDYRRRGGVDHAEIVGWSGTRSELWNAAEKAERRKDGTPAREYEIALPRELDREQREELAREYAQWLHERHGVAVDVCIHGHDTDNPHAHLLATTRVVDAQGQSLGDKAAVEWSDRKRKQHGMEGRKTELAAARETWQNLANKALERAGQAERIDHRTLEAQRTEALEQGDVERAAKLDREPQKWNVPASRATEAASTASAKSATRSVRGFTHAYAKPCTAWQLMASKHLNSVMSKYSAALQRSKSAPRNIKNDSTSRRDGAAVAMTEEWSFNDE